MPVNQERSQDGQDNLQEDIHNKREERISRRPFLSILARLRQDLVDEVADVVNECVHEAGENCCREHVAVKHMSHFVGEYRLDILLLQVPQETSGNSYHG